MTATSNEEPSAANAAPVAVEGSRLHDGVPVAEPAFLPASQLAPSVFSTTPLIVIDDR